MSLKPHIFAHEFTFCELEMKGGHILSIKFVGNHIELSDPPKRPKKLTGTRLAAVLGYNKWSTPFEAWCAITRTYEKPFEGTIYTEAGKVIEPKITDYLRKRYFMELKSPEDVYGADFFKKTWGDFFGHIKIFGGMWDALGEDYVVEIKTTKRAEDWETEPPLNYMLQGALYAWLLGFDDVLMVCAFLEDEDYHHPEKFVPTIANTILHRFKISERFPNFEDDVILPATLWWTEHVEKGVSPEWDEKKDAEILKALRTNVVDDDANDEARTLSDLVAEYEAVTEDVDRLRERYGIDKLEKLAKELNDQIKSQLVAQFRETDKTVKYSSPAQTYTVTKSERVTLDTKALKADKPDVFAAYAKTSTTYTLKASANKE